ncbi:hypothetical protein M4D81_33220 [Paenibacillus sp. p3-SID867]|uniref:hypothetical protein n=1 Tax=Paenibacillus sp. p3-SID867 TaxID=2916363 RepID=UPI0021A3F845|nr:hypothetical protein [Paenibacillus sp. p3-SID867]MCT1403870.1 hypothetical protein [Paenibacillus sp. p3-SID867]
MRISTRCAVCDILENDYESYFMFDITDEIIIQSVTCPKGHPSVLILTHQRFELLFDMGLHALNDGYYREAATNFAVAVERFHEFSIEVMTAALKNNFGKPHGGNNFNSQYISTWKKMSQQSERQLGAYMMLYLLSFNKSPDMLSNKTTQFRNEVTHKGTFPSKERVMEYGETVFNYIKDKLEELRHTFPEAFEYVSQKQLNQALEQNANGVLVQINQTATFNIDEETGELYHNSFEEALFTCSKFQFLKSDPV